MGWTDGIGELHIFDDLRRFRNRSRALNWSSLDIAVLLLAAYVGEVEKVELFKLQAFGKTAGEA